MHSQPQPVPPDSAAASTDTGNGIAEKEPEPSEESGLNWLNTIPNGTIYSYNLDDRKTPGGLKVRWKIRVATGPEAGRWDARQTEAIKELLVWASQHVTR
jgi:hypothetical protein